MHIGSKGCFFIPVDSLVTIKTFTYAHEAAIAKSLLTSEGIFCFLKDELTIQTNQFYSNALGGVKLQVRQSDADVAADILRKSSPSGNAPQTIEIRTATGELEQCPACGSEELSLTRKPSGLIFGLSLLLFGFPLTIFSKVYHCYECSRDIKVRRQ